MAQAFKARGCEVAKASIEFTDDRWVPSFSCIPDEAPGGWDRSILLAQFAMKTRAADLDPAAGADRRLRPGSARVSHFRWFQTSMPIRSYLESPEANMVLSGKLFVCASISRRYYGINLRQQKKLGKKNGGRWTRQDALRRRGRSGQVDALAARVHEVQLAAGARHGAEDAGSEPQASTTRNRRGAS